MGSRQDERRTWLCQAADRLGLLDAPSRGDANGPAGRDEPVGMLARWIRRHVERCDYCRAEAFRWGRTVARLRQLDRPVAPAGLLDRVVATIALEKSVGVEGAGEALGDDRTRLERATGWRRERGGRRSQGSKRLWGRDDLWAGETLIGIVLVWATAMGGLGGAAVLLSHVLGLVHPVIALAMVSATWWRGVVVEALTMFDKASYAFPIGMQPYVAGLFWCFIGFFLTAFIIGVSGRRPVMSSDWR